MAGCCGCCTALKPRYKRLVDNIFPVNPQDGLVKNNMDKLTFYAISSPEKLDRIGEYLVLRLSRDVHRHRIEFVFIAMDALDQLLVVCHSQSINLFVESFLKMVQKLLECDEPGLQILATSSFVKFANIEEDTPSYHRRYDFFVSKFSSMCHNSMENENDRMKIRSVGLQGLQGVVRKTVSDELQVNIWDPVHMDKIVPSLLYNMYSPEFMSVDLESPKDEEHPAFIAETVLRDLVCRASYDNIKSVLRPVLVHLDNHKLWVPNDFAAKVFKIILYSVQQQYGYVVNKMLISHLEKHSNSDRNVKYSIMQVLYQCVVVSAGNSVGPSVPHVFNSLLRYLMCSLENKSKDPIQRNYERKFEECIVNTVGEFAGNLPDYQKIENMMVIMRKFPACSSEDEIGSFSATLLPQYQMMLLKTLLMVATKYKTVTFASAFPPEFLHPLLRLSLFEDPSMRITVQEILHTLIDRHDNTQKFRTVFIPKDIAQLDLTVEKPSRQDILFMKKSGMQIYWHIIENMQMETNRVDNFEALYCTMALLCIETGGQDIVVELFRLALEIQQIAVETGSLPMTHKCVIHGVVAAYMNLMAQLTAIPALCTYVTEVIENRRKEAPHFLPNFAFNRNNRPNSPSENGDISSLINHSFYPAADNVRDGCFFNQNSLSEALASSGHDASRMAVPFTNRPIFEVDISRSVSDIQSINLEVESSEGSPSMNRKTAVDDEITVESLKKMLAEDNTEKQKEIERKRHEILETFRTAPFEEIVARSEAKSNHFHNKLNEILDMVSKPQDSPNSSRKSGTRETIPVFEMQFPDLYVY